MPLTNYKMISEIAPKAKDFDGGVFNDLVLQPIEILMSSWQVMRGFPKYVPRLPNHVLLVIK